MSIQLKALIAAVGSAATLLLGWAAVNAPIRPEINSPSGFPGLLFWVVVGLLASAFPVHSPRGAVVSVQLAPTIAAAALGGPFAASIVALLGSIEWREVTGRVPWYGTLYNHSSAVIPAVIAGYAYESVAGREFTSGSVVTLVGVTLAGVSFFAINELLTAAAVSIRDSRRFSGIVAADLRAFGLPLLGLAPLAWLMAHAYHSTGPVSVFIFALPLYTTRAAYASVVEIRRMFTQTVKALASAIDARDYSTRKHSEWVATISVDLGKAMGLGESQLEQLEWAGLLHDVGKIGIPDAVLLKEGPLDRDERIAMNKHPETGHAILAGVDKLTQERQFVLHHHQWFNGSGYPKVQVGGEFRPLVGEEIPLEARIMHLADAYEAMTRSRPYRPIPLSHEQALAEIRKFSGIQFDPRIVDVFMAIDFESTAWARLDRDALNEQLPAGPTIPALGQVAAMKAHAVKSPPAAAR